MPEFNLKESIITSLNAQEPWPDNVKLFQPYEVEQILLPDNASCLAVQAFLKMCNLPFDVEMRWNAEFMSPSGRVPFIKCGAFVVSELEPIVQFAANKGVTLTARLSTEEKAEMRAYMSLITNVLVNAELYISWVDNDTYNAVTKVRNASVYPWPLGWIQTRAKRAAVVKRLKALHWHEKTLQSVLADVEQCCNSLTQHLGDKDYFFGTPTPLDALLYGHIRALLSATGPKAPLLIKPITSPLLRLVLRVTSLTKMKLTPQEEYLVSQAFQLTKRRLSPNRVFSDRNTRVRKSRLSERHSSRDCTRNAIGNKPFACKNMLMRAKDVDIPCEYEQRRMFEKVAAADADEERNSYIVKTLDEILYKVDELTSNKDEYCDQHDFEIIVFPPPNASERSESPINKYHEGLFLKTIDETNIDTFDSGDIDILTVGQIIDLTVEEDVIKIIDEASSKQEIEESVEESVEESNEVSDAQDSQNFMSIDSSNQEKEDESVVSNSIDDKTLLQFDVSITEADTADSKSTLVMPSNEDISVEDIVKFLRERNAVYKQAVPVADTD